MVILSAEQHAILAKATEQLMARHHMTIEDHGPPEDYDPNDAVDPRVSSARTKRNRQKHTSQGINSAQPEQEAHGIARGYHRRGSKYQNSRDYNDEKWYYEPHAPAGPGYSYTNAPRTRNGDQQSDPLRSRQIQINYLDTLALRIPDCKSIREDGESKETLRLALLKIALKALQSYGESHGFDMDSTTIDFKCIGGSRNGLALPGGDLDLTLTIHGSDCPSVLGPLCPLILESAFLEAGFGARLLSHTKAPILKVCQKPSPQLLNELKKERENRDRPLQQASSMPESAALGRKPATQSFGPHRPAKPITQIEFPEAGAGIICNISFTGHLAICNTELLRCYALYDGRVRELGMFVKMWAKARNINSPYHGTLSSYGYILMMIHYLSNVARPPVVPNLQAPDPPFQLPRPRDVDGYNVQFISTEKAIANYARHSTRKVNHQSVGELLRGFFAYYAGQGRGGPLGGFNWIHQTISIRTRGGILEKSAKGWTTVKSDADGNRHHHLLAIEDPFELEHNVARTVTLAGVNAIKAEFRRTQTIIERVQEIPGIGWEWRKNDGEVGEDFLAAVRNQRPRCNPGQYSANQADINTSNPQNDDKPPRTEIIPTELINHEEIGANKARESPTTLSANTISWNPLIKSLPSAKTERDERTQVNREVFKKQVEIAAEKMRRLLQVPKPEATATEDTVSLPKPLNHDSRQFHGPDSISDREAACLDRESLRDHDSDLDNISDVVCCGDLPKCSDLD
ncbi:hypothetical protein ASPZODRAFT_134214 [Penicilliopsis zonata CBS 506.65]|uniref:PAP-associated domain-containing protein n=1 Tax=Penicilliopsis zonata CBS 506.65 TaxID=1073090 RepID=A0A1L9SET8_9EURO|nr:hypothetical protein ASPZODRAFT_134214 [Penicilliopsis zonata CBS 506.65]OJJ45534.1 hypothetical protein ASPZODRAFT_134214 [Penicilliopsis zonata CBS 506.65]